MTQVGVGEIAILPTFKGFRSRVDAESSATGKSAAARLSAGFSSAGESAGKGFSSAFGRAAGSVSTAALKQATADVAKASREVSTLRLREQDATGKVRVAEAQLSDARRRYASDSAQVVRAEERLSAEQRRQQSAVESLTAATKRLSDAKDSVSAASGGDSGSWFSRIVSSFGYAGQDSGNRFSAGFRTNVGQIFTGSFLADLAAGAVRSVTSAAVDATRAGLQYAWDGVRLASDAEQNLGAVQAVFKEYADSVSANAANAANAVGLSRSKYSQFAVVVGAQLKNLGVRTQDVAGKTNDLITLGADL